MTDDLKGLENEISAWPGVSAHPHRFGGREFRLGTAEIGHTHEGGIVDIPFPLSLHDALLTEHLAERHRWVPNSGWVTFQIRKARDVQHAKWLMRLSYLRYRLKTGTDPVTLLQQESEELDLNPRIKGLLEQFVPAEARRAFAQAAK